MQQAQGPDHRDVAASVNNLALLYASRSEEIQAPLSGDEAMVLFSVADKESCVFAINRESFDWKSLPLGAEALSRKVAAFRRGLGVAGASDAGRSGLFDLDLANNAYPAFWGPFAQIGEGAAYWLLCVATETGRW